jgi:tetratricopeptide (TPR) repeat protein
MALAGVVLLLVLLGAAGGAARLVAQQPADSAQPAAAPANAAASDAPQPAQGEALRAQRDRLAREARALMDAGKRPEALAAAEQMLAIQRQLDDAAFSPWGDWIAWAAGEHEAAGRFESALRWRQEGVEVCRRLYGERAWQTTDARLALQHARRLQQLAPHQRQALAKADAQQQQVIQLHGQGQYARAIPLAAQVLEVRQQLLGEEHPDTATSLNNLALLYVDQGDYARAEPLYQQALAIRKKVLGEEHPDTATSLNNLARIYRRQGDYARAEPLYQQALAIRKKVLGEEHPPHGHQPQ